VIVVDTSAMISALAGSPPDPDLVARLGDDGDLHAPHLIDIEMLNALRRLVATGSLTLERASDVRLDFGDLTILRYPHHPLADRMWDLRHNITAYDAAFVALGEALKVPLITCDGRLASTSGHEATIELFAHR
jgi:predicted nucleic acid-binding protein